MNFKNEYIKAVNVAIGGENVPLKWRYTKM